MHLLYPRGVVGGNDNIVVAEILHLPASFSTETNTFHAGIFSVCQGIDHIRAIATGADADQQITFFAEGFHLPVEDAIEPIVVSYSS